VEKLKKAKEFYLLLVFFISLIWGLFKLYQAYLDTNEEILDRLNTTQQMSLKSVIWNDNIPLGERMTACDTYLGQGYNSLTKKHCEKILKESE
jgi:hypothetical protein